MAIDTRREMKIQIVVDAALDLRYIHMVGSSPKEQAEHLVRCIAAKLFTEDLATLLVGDVRVEARDPTTAHSGFSYHILHTEMRDDTKGFDTPKEMNARWGGNYADE